MRYWRYVEQGKDDEPVVKIVSDSEILDRYWEWWSKTMNTQEKVNYLNKENCILDFVTVNWAEEVKIVPVA